MGILFCLIILTVSLAGAAAGADGIEISGDTVTGINQNQYSYNADTQEGTLKLNGGEWKYINATGVSDLTIILEGVNNITGGGYIDLDLNNDRLANIGIYVQGNLIIQGGGTLNVDVTEERNYAYGVYSDSSHPNSSSISIYGSTVTVNVISKNVNFNNRAYGIYSSSYADSTIKFIDSTVKVYVTDNNYLVYGIYSISHGDPPSGSSTICIDNSTVTVKIEDGGTTYGIYSYSSSYSSNSSTISISESDVTVDVTSLYSSEVNGIYSQSYISGYKPSSNPNYSIILIDKSRVEVKVECERNRVWGIYSGASAGSGSSLITISESDVTVDVTGNDNIWGIYSSSKYGTFSISESDVTVGVTGNDEIWGIYSSSNSSTISISESDVTVGVTGNNNIWGIYFKSYESSSIHLITISGAQTKLLAIGNTQAICFNNGGTFTVQDELRVRAATNTEGSGLELLSDESEAIDTAKGYKYVTIAQGGYVSYDLNGGKGSKPPRTWYNQSETITLASAPAKGSSMFTGWKSGLDTYPADTSFIMPNGDVAFIAQWAEPYIVKFHNNTGSGSMDDQIFYIGVEQKLNESTFTKEGHTFAGWAESEIGDVKYGDNAFVKNLTTTPDGTVDLYAKWNVNKYTVSFNANGGTPALIKQQVEHNKKAEKPTEPTKTGHTFIRWENNSAEWDFNTPITQDVTLFANWTINQYTITFNTNGGTAVDSITQDYETAVTAPANPTKNGYTFIGWDKAIPSTMPAENMVITAQWKANNSGGGSIIIGKNTHSVTFNANGGEGSMEEQNFISGEEKELSENKFQRAGHTFEGWAESADGNVVYTDCEKIKVTKSMTLYAVWKAETPVEPVVPEEPVLPALIIGGVIAVLLAAGLIIFAVKKRR